MPLYDIRSSMSSIYVNHTKISDWYGLVSLFSSMKYNDGQGIDLQRFMFYISMKTKHSYIHTFSMQ